MSRYLKIILACLILFMFARYATVPAFANDTFNIPSISVNFGAVDGQSDPASVATSLQLIFLLTIIALSPTILIMFTCFTRFIISLHFLRSALGTQQMPPNQVLLGLAVFLTFFLMGDTFTTINDTALQPYSRGEISQEQAIEIGVQPIREFMLSQVEPKDLALFVGLAGEVYENESEIPNRVLFPSFVLSEITKGFTIGFIVYIPFIAIDMIVASTLMAMGMMMLPPAMISLPFKILLFVLTDGWNIFLSGVIRSFQ